MKKILFVINTMGHAGAEMALLELLRHIDPEEYEVSLYVLMAQGEMARELPDYVKLLNKHYDNSSVLEQKGRAHMQKMVLKAFFARGTGFRLLPYLMKNLASMIRKKAVLIDKLLWRVLSDGGERISEHYDLAVAYLEGGSAYYVADHVKADKKAVFLHVDYEKAGYTRALDKDCYLAFDKVFCVSDEVKTAFLKVYPQCRERAEIFHNLINQDAIRKKAKLSGGFSDAYDGFRILTVGRLTPQKAFEVSIEAMKLLKESGVWARALKAHGLKARWYVLGEGSERRFLEEEIKRFSLEEDFILLGAAQNPYPYMAQADIYVHASRFEGKSIAIQEAQTLGCAILVSDCSGNREQVIPGVDGMMCGFTPQEICQGIQELLQDEALRRRLGEAAAKKQLTDEAEVNKLLDLL